MIAVGSNHDKNGRLEKVTKHDKYTVYDDDSSKMTKDMLSQFQRMNSVVVPVSPEDSRKIKEFGKDYKRILGSLLSAVLNDSELIKKCVS